MLASDEAANGHVLAELEVRGVCDREFGLTTASWLAAETHGSRPVLAARVKAAVKLRRLPVVDEALSDGPISPSTPGCWPRWSTRASKPTSSTCRTSWWRWRGGARLWRGGATSSSWPSCWTKTAATTRPGTWPATSCTCHPTAATASPSPANWSVNTPWRSPSCWTPRPTGCGAGSAPTHELDSRPRGAVAGHPAGPGVGRTHRQRRRRPAPTGTGPDRRHHHGRPRRPDQNAPSPPTAIVVARDVVRHLACDATITPVTIDHHGNPTRCRTRHHRYATPAQRRALAVRDGGCVFPGCDLPAGWCDAHHVTPWEAGGDHRPPQLGPAVSTSPRRHPPHRVDHDRPRRPDLHLDHPRPAEPSPANATAAHPPLEPAGQVVLGVGVEGHRRSPLTWASSSYSGSGMARGTFQSSSSATPATSANGRRKLK